MKIMIFYRREPALKNGVEIQPFFRAFCVKQVNREDGNKSRRKSSSDYPSVSSFVASFRLENAMFIFDFNIQEISSKGFNKDARSHRERK
ncbi:hypothetical protein IM774_09485 [Erysipelotrichaceae bacterium RD49]|nr:hypothetical protein [Erysipelotrichaceae bacterium RD49]